MKRYIITVEDSHSQDAAGVAIWHSQEDAQAVADMLSESSDTRMTVVELPE